VTPISVLFDAVPPRELMHCMNAQSWSAPSEGRDEGVDPIETITLCDEGELALPPAPQVFTSFRLHLDELYALAQKQALRELSRDPLYPGGMRVSEGGEV
jgi:hypothetical protein